MNKEWEFQARAYKVLSKEDSGLYSACTFGPLRTKYKVGEWVRGKYSLFVFETEEHAVLFAENLVTARRDNIVIYKCFARNARKIPFVLTGYALKSWLSLAIFWDSVRARSMICNHITHAHAPAGTLIADKVMLIREVA